MAKSKKSKASTKAKRVASANKARQTLINKEIAKYEANKKRAKNLKKARKALVQKEVDKAERKNKRKIAQARSSARAANRRAYAADQRADVATQKAHAANRRANAAAARASAANARASEADERASRAARRANAASARASEASERANAAERKAAARSAENYKLHKELSRRKRPAGARVQAASTMWLAVGALIFAILFAFLYAAVDREWLSKNIYDVSYKQAQIAYTVFLCLMIGSIVGLLVLVSPIWGTLRREGHLTGTAKASMIIIWIFCAFAFAVFIIDILTSASSWYRASDLVSIDEDAEIILNYISLCSPVILLIFSGVLYGSIKKSYPLA